MLLHEGDRCNELRRAESERILRAQPFIAEAPIRVVRRLGGEVTLDVRTTDEVALVLGAASAAGSPPVRSLVRVGDANISAARESISPASGVTAARFATAIGGRFVDNQFLGRPYTLAAKAHQNPLGDDWLVDATHPFYTDIQRFAWRARVGRERRLRPVHERHQLEPRDSRGRATISTSAASSESVRRDD